MAIILKWLFATYLLIDTATCLLRYLDVSGGHAHEQDLV